MHEHSAFGCLHLHDLLANGRGRHYSIGLRRRRKVLCEFADPEAHPGHAFNALPRLKKQDATILIH